MADVKKEGKSRIWIILLFVVIASYHIYGSENSTNSSSFNSTFNDIVNLTIMDNNLTNQTFYTNVSTRKNETNITQNKTAAEGFSIDVNIRDKANISRGDMLFFDVNITLFGIEIYSITSNVSIILPDNTSIYMNMTKNGTSDFGYQTSLSGRHEILVESMFRNESHVKRKEFFVEAANISNTSIEEPIIDQKTESVNMTKVFPDFSINLSDKYYYEHGPVLITGNASAFIDGEPANMSVEIELYPKGKKHRKSFCTFELYGSREFYCELRNIIELTTYVAEVTGYHEGEEKTIMKNFSLSLPETEEIQLELDFLETVKTSEQQSIFVNATRGDEILAGADVSVQIIDPNNVIYSIASEEIQPGLYQANFYGLEKGNHTIKVTYSKDSEFKTVYSYFVILPKNLTMSILMPDVLYHSTGSLNISGELELMLDNESIEGDISLAIYSEDNLKRTCLLYCPGRCNFTCPLENYIEFTKYRIYATLLYDFIDYSTYKEFQVRFKEVELGLNTSYKQNYTLNEIQEYVINAYDMKTEQPIEDATIYVEIFDPEQNVYRIIPTPRVNGIYDFEFIGLVPGEYNISMTFIKDAIYAKRNFSVYVSEEEYQITPEAEKNITLVQLPAEVGKKVRWIREIYVDNQTLQYNPRVVLSRFAENLRIDNLHREDMKLLYNDSEISFAELKRWNEYRNAIREYKELLSKEKEAGMIERLGLTQKIENSMKNVRELEKVVEFNITDDPILKLENLTGYHVIAYETPAPKKVEREIEDNRKQITVYTDEDIHYEKVLAYTNITASYPDQIKLYWLKDDKRELFENLDYHDGNNDGLIDSISWMVPYLSNQTFEVIILVENETFKIGEIEQLQQYDSARFVVQPNWARLPSGQNVSCTLVIQNISYDMQYDNGFFEYYYEFQNPGIVDYKVLCNDQLQESQIEILNSEDIVRRRTEYSKTYFINDLFYLTEMHMEPIHYQDGILWKNIDTNFISSQNQYEIRRNVYDVRLSKDVSNEYIFDFRKDDLSIQSKPVSIVYYDSSSGSYATLYNINSRNEMRIFKDKNTVRYDNYFDFIDLVFESYNDRIKQNIIMSREAISSLPNPAAFGMDEAKTYVMVSTEIDTSLEIPEIATNDRIMLRQNSFLDKDYYYPLDSKGSKKPMFRKIINDNGMQKILSGIRYSELKNAGTAIVLDPTFTVKSTDRDAMSINSNTNTDYYDAASQYLFFGRNGTETYQAGVQFQLDVPRNATIVSAYISFTPGENASNGTFYANISIEDTDNAAVYFDGAGNISTHAAYHTNTISWYISNWSQDYNYTTSDISKLIENITNRTTWQKGNYIAFMIDEGNSSGSYRSFDDFSSPDAQPAVLTVIYLAEESRPVVNLDMPENATFTDNNTLQFNFTPVDTEGLDICELWGNFSGSWKLNHTLDDVVNDSSNNFSTIVLDDGLYIWNVWCNDTMGNYKFNLTDFEFTVDTGAPNVTLKNPENEANISSFNINFNFSVVDEFSPNATCNLTLDDITNISGILINNTDWHNETLVNITSGRHNWSVSCQDYAGSLGISESFNFTVSRPLNLSIWDQGDTYSNISLYENVTFYANLSDINDNPVDDANCILHLNNTAEHTMIYNPTSLFYEITSQMNISGFIDYNVTCIQQMYDSANASDYLYIYPKTNASISKKITPIKSNKFNITIDYRNLANYSGYIEVIDFIHNNFNVSFSLIPTGSSPVQGDFFGKAYFWRFFLNGLQKGNFSYVVEANESYYQYVKLYMMGFDASDR